MKWLTFLFGLVVFILAWLMAFFGFVHFYEFLLVGLFLIFLSIIKRISHRKYLWLYLFFFIGGVVADLFFGLWLTRLWSYNFNSYIDYIPIYLLVYPLGGIVIVQSYFFFEKIFVRKLEKVKVSLRWLKGLSFLFLILLVGLVVFNFFVEIVYFGFFLSVFSTGFVFFVFNYSSEKDNDKSLLGYFLAKPKEYSLVIFLSSYVMAFVHEFPNTFVWEWVYTNWPWLNVEFLRVPVVVFFLGWLFLTVVPVSLYYGLKD